MSNNTQLPADFKNPFKKGDYIKCGEQVILVTGEGDHVTRCAGVIVESDQSWHPVGDYSKTWHAWKFEKIEYATKLHEAQQEIKALKGGIETHKRSYDARSKDYDELDANHDTACALLEKVIASESFPKLRDYQLYNDIKSFLDGTK